MKASVSKAAHQQTVLIFAAVFILVLLALVNVVLAIFVGAVWVIPVIVAADLGVSRQRTGWMWGFFLGWLGVLILACMRAPGSGA